MMKFCKKLTLSRQYFFLLANQNSCGVFMLIQDLNASKLKTKQPIAKIKILIVSTTINNEYILINSYNARNEQEQVNTLANLHSIKHSTKTNPEITILEILVYKIQPEIIKYKIYAFQFYYTTMFKRIKLSAKYTNKTI